MFTEPGSNILQLLPKHAIIKAIAHKFFQHFSIFPIRDSNEEGRQDRSSSAFFYLN